MSGKKQLDIGFVFGLFTTLSVSWFYIKDTIIDLGVDDPVSSFLFPLSILHYILFLLLISTMLLLFGHGINFSNFDISQNARFKSIIHVNQQFLFKFWLPVLLISGLSFAFSSIADKDSVITFTLLIFTLLVIILYILFGKDVKFLFDALNPFAIAGMTLGYVFYFLAMSYFCSNVAIETNNDFYTTKDTVLVSVIRKGYIFLPRIEAVNFSGDPICNSPSNFKLILDKRAITDMPYIQVTYKPQIFEIPRKKYRYLNVAH